MIWLLAGCNSTPDTPADTGTESPTTCLGTGGETDPITLDPGEVQGLLNQVPVYAANFDLLFDGSWTNWYKDPLQEGLIKLAVMRSVLESYNLFDVHLDGALVGNVTSLDCPPDAERVRSIDGTCNDPFDPAAGAAGSRIARNLPLDAVWPDEASVLDPNPREISRSLLTRPNGEVKEAEILNLLAAAWVQFEVHDWFSHGENAPTDAWAVPLADDDPLRVERGQSELLVLRTAPDPTRTPEEDGPLPPTTVNEVTHWWDASQVYGSDADTAARLRTFEGGHLALVDGRLPLHADGASDAGFRRNWWIGLELLHALFAREHNAIADHLAAAYPNKTDQELYDLARMINAATIAKIHTLEWTPAILPNPTLEVAMNANWYGLNRYVEPPFEEGSDPILFGVVGNTRQLHGAPYAMTEEFVAVYRMHPLLPESFTVREPADGTPLATIPTADTRDAAAAQAVTAWGEDRWLYSFGAAHPGALVLDNYPTFLQELELVAGVATDLATVDLLRDRERGVPRYNEVRRLLSLRPIASFEELSDDPDVVARLTAAYGGDVEKLDLLVGTLAEGTRPTCYGFGETLFQVFTLMATRRLAADRFYTDLYNADTYTPEGLAWIEEATMKSVLLRHHPGLAGALSAVDNAFRPW